jgi:hypothetical protein
MDYPGHFSPDSFIGSSRIITGPVQNYTITNHTSARPKHLLPGTSGLLVRISKDQHHIMPNLPAWKSRLVRLIASVYLIPRAHSLESSPCHDWDIKYRPSPTCEKVTIPTGFCQVCGVNAAITNTGDYLDCTVSYGFTNAALQLNQPCLTMIEKYVTNNPCDAERRNAVNLYKSADPIARETGRQVLDYFVYSICENGCDCIQQVNAKPWQLTADVHRGNCQAHAYWDLCRHYPNMKLIRGEGTVDDNVANLPAVCPFLLDWLENSGDGWNFRDKPHTTVVPQVEYFLHRLIEAEELLTGTLLTNVLWKQCLTLEVTQGRVSTVTSSAPVAAPSAVPTIKPMKFPLLVSAGETDPAFVYTDASGAIWGYDQYYSGTGATSNVVAEVVKTVDDRLFQRQRFGIDLRYSLPTGNGKYKVTLYMAEMTLKYAGARVFNVVMEGVVTQANVDLFAIAGRRRSAIFLVQNVTVADGALDVVFASVTGIPSVAGIKVERY